MKKIHFATNLNLIRAVWSMSRQEIGDVLGCKKHQIAHYERNAIGVPLPVLFLLEDLTGISARRLYYEVLTRAEILNQPLSENTEPLKAVLFSDSAQMTLAERVTRLEIKVFGTSSELVKAK